MASGARAGKTRAMGWGFLSEAGWLNAKRVGGYLRLLALLNLAVIGWLVATSHGGVDRNGFLIGTDFISFWTAGRMLHAGQDVYDVAAHIAAQRQFYASDGAHTAFFYPPQFLFLCWPLGLLPYFPALAAWLVATAALFAGAVRGWIRRFGPDRPAWLLVAAFPAALVTVTHGQTAFLVAALLGAGALLVRERPWVAGMLFGLAAFKPQFGLLVPVVLVLTGQWRPILAAAVTIALAGLLATLAFGPDVWARWLAVSDDAGAAMGGGAIGFAKLQSLFAAARLLGAGEGLAYGLQGLLSIGVVGMTAWASWRRHYTPAHASLMLAGAPLVTPFVLDYDMLLTAFPLLWLATREARAWERITIAAVFVAPAFARPLAMGVGVPIMVPLLIALFVLVARRAREAEAAFPVSSSRA